MVGHSARTKFRLGKAKKQSRAYAAELAGGQAGMYSDNFADPASPADGARSGKVFPVGRRWERIRRKPGPGLAGSGSGGRPSARSPGRCQQWGGSRLTVSFFGLTQHFQKALGS